MKRNRRIPALDPYRKPGPPGGAFAALSWPQQRAAEQLLWGWCQKWGTNLPPWRLAILVARAQRLALHPLGSAWGKSLRCSPANPKAGAVYCLPPGVIPGRTMTNHVSRW
jgi:hypothetical protein